MQAIHSTTGHPAPQGDAHGAKRDGTHAGPDRPKHLAVFVGGAGIVGNTRARAHAAG